MKISLISTSKISATWPGKLQYLHENEKVKFVLWFVKPARTTFSHE